jgi:hypothetical protein
MAPQAAADGLSGAPVTGAASGERREVSADALVLAILAGLAVLVLALLLGMTGLPAVVVAIVSGVFSLAVSRCWLAILLPSLTAAFALARGWRGSAAVLLVSVAVAVTLIAHCNGLAIDQGTAILVVGLTAAIGSFFEYRRRLDDRRQSVAVALSAEIRVNAEVTYLSLAPAVLAQLATKPKGFRPFAVPVPPDYPVYVGNQDALGLLPPCVVADVVRFYEVDESLTQAYNALGMQAFHRLERERQNQLYAYIAERMEADYLPTARRALDGLAAVAKVEPDLPAFLTSEPRGKPTGAA